MISSTIVTLLLVGTLFSFGYLLQALKKFISLLFKVILNILSFFGVKLYEKEKQIKITPEFSAVYKDIKVMKLSNKNLKERSSIDWFAVTLLLVAGLLVVLNMKGVFVAEHNVISDWMYRAIKNFKIVKSETDMNTLYTAAMFSTLSFAFSKIVNRWKETKINRDERKRLKLKEKALELLSTKELLEQAKNKDKQQRELVQ